MSALGEAIRTRRRALNLSQRALGERASLATSHICQIEKGKSMPGVEALAAIAKGLDVPVGDLMHTVTPKTEPLVVDLRDWFAGQELAKVDCVSVCGEPSEYARLATHCYRMADAMLAARSEAAEAGGASHG